MGARPFTVDVHAHLATPACAEMVCQLDSGHSDVFDSYSSAESKAHNQRIFADSRLHDIGCRLADMDRMGIDVQVLSVAPPQFYYWTGPELGAAVSRLHNEHLAEVRDAHPDRFACLGTVPLQDIQAAVAELRYCASDLGFPGVEICSSVNGLDLDDPRFRPFFREAAALGVLVLVHPHGFASDRLSDYYLVNVIGNPLDTTLAMSRLLLSGIFEELPGLRMAFVHGGGYLPLYPGRLYHAFRVRPEMAKHLTHLPTVEASGIYVDSLVYEPDALAVLIRRMGADHVFLGTDYPYDMGMDDPVGMVDSVPGLDRAGYEAVLGGNARTLLRL